MSPRLPSLRVAAEEAGRVLVRFPVVLAAAAVAAVLGSMMVHKDPSARLVGCFAAATLAIPLYVATSVAAERAASRRVGFVLHGAVLAVLLVFAQAWPEWPGAVQARRYAQLSLAAHLLVAFLPYLRRDEPNGFWQWNRVLFLRFLTAGLFSSVLYGGLAIALLALNQLFKIKIEPEVYLRLWVWIAFVFNTWFFLGGLPRDLELLEGWREYPTLLKVFSQFILMPLVAIYLAILTAYLGRILITGQWPKGWIGWLVSCVSVAGILSLLLVHPIREREENRWVATYARWFYVALLPSIGMLLAAIYQRVDQYGVTEDRYFLLVLTLWLAVIAVFFIARRRADIRVIPMTLCALALVTMFGPWSAFDVSLRSQLSRIRLLLIRHGMLENGVVHAATGPVPFEARKQLSSALSYVIGTHGAEPVRRLLGQAFTGADTAAISGPTSRSGNGEWLAGVAMRALGLDYVNSWDGPGSSTFAYLSTRNAVEIEDIAGALHKISLQGPLPFSFMMDGRIWEVRLAGAPKELRVTRGTEALLAFPADSLVERARASRGSAGWPALRLVAETAGTRVTLVARTYNGRIDDDGPLLQYLDGDLYVGPAGPP